MLAIHRNGLAVALALSLTSVVVVACRAGSDLAGDPGSQTPDTRSTIDPSNFVLPVDNPYFPLEPGTTYRHEGVKEGSRAVDVFTVIDETRMILGVANTVVVDKLYVDGRLEAIAHDWYTTRMSTATSVGFEMGVGRGSEREHAGLRLTHRAQS
jgi:hypothetical protein